MKKKLAVLLAAMLSLVLLVGCGGKKDEPSTDSGEDKSITINSGKIVMSTESGFPPFEYVDEKGDVVGVDVDIATKVAEKLGVELQIKDMEFQQALMAVQNGQSDMVCAGLSITEDRKQSMDFTQTYLESSNLIIKKKDNTEINGPEDLKGKVIGTQTGTTGDEFAQESKADGVAKEVKGYQAYAQAIIDLKNGKIDCIITDEIPAKNYVAQNDDLAVAEKECFKTYTAIAVKKGNEELLKTIDEVLTEMKNNGELQASFDKHSEA